MLSRTAGNIPLETLKQFRPFKLIEGNVSSSSVRQNEAKKTADYLAKVLKDRFKASKVMLFGSAIRTDFSHWSDIDLAVWGVSFFDYFRAVAFTSGYSSIFKVDLVDAEDCSPSLLQHITDSGVEL